MLASLWRAAVCGFAVSVLENVIWRRAPLRVAIERLGCENVLRRGRIAHFLNVCRIQPAKIARATQRSWHAARPLARDAVPATIPRSPARTDHRGAGIGGRRRSESFPETSRRGKNNA